MSCDAGDMITFAPCRTAWPTSGLCQNCTTDEGSSVRSRSLLPADHALAMRLHDRLEAFDEAHIIIGLGRRRLIAADMDVRRQASAPPARA